MKHPKCRFPGVVIHWMDARTNPGQYTLEAAKKIPLRYRQTTGWLLTRDKGVVRVVHDWDPEEPDDPEGVGNVTVIPTSWVKKIERI